MSHDLSVQVLVISPLEEDHDRLRLILQHSQWRQHDTRTQKEALAFLHDNPTQVVICESELPDGTWQDLLSQLGRMQHPPMLIVASVLADAGLWSQVLNLGGHNVLAKPLDRREVLHVVNSACSSWQNQRQPTQRQALRICA